MKKIISLLLAALLLLSLLPMAIFAEGNSGEIVLPTDCFHSRFIYTNNGENHTVTCKDCGTVIGTEAHTFVEGICVCGAVEQTGPEYIEDASLTFTSNISAGAEMQVYFSIMNATVSGYTDFYLEVTKDNADGTTTTKVFGTGDGREAFAVIANPRTGVVMGYSAIFTGIWAKEMGDDFHAVLYAVDANGDIHHSTEYASSMKDYLMGKYASDPSMKDACIATLNYGAAAQVYFDYDTENLANADLTAEEQIVPMPTIEKTNTVTGSFNSAVTPNCSLQNKVALAVTFRVNTGDYNGTTDFSRFSMHIQDAEGNLVATAPITTGRTTASFLMAQATYDQLKPKNMRDEYQFTLYDGDTPISNTLHWSIEGYVGECQSNDKAAMSRAMLVYGDVVAAYLANQ